MDWDKKCLVDFKAEKTELLSFDRYQTNGSIDMKVGGSVLEEK